VQPVLEDIADLRASLQEFIAHSGQSRSPVASSSQGSWERGRRPAVREAPRRSAVGGGGPSPRGEPRLQGGEGPAMGATPPWSGAPRDLRSPKM
jgi:hypothetical protein